MAEKDNGRYITTRELAAEMRSIRWEMRFLIALSVITNIGLGYKLNVPGVSEAVSFVIGALPF